MLNKGLSRIDLYVITLFFGFSSAIAQVLLIRELLTIFRGNELIIGIIFAAWFIGIYLGARFNPEGERVTLERRVVLCLILFPILLLFFIYLPHFIPFVIPRTVGTFYSITTELILSLLFTIPISFLIGFFFPPVVSLTSAVDGKLSGGNIYYLETLGAFAGGILFTAILIDFLNPLGIISIIISISHLIYLKKYKNRLNLFLLFIPLMLLLMSERIENCIFEFVWERTHEGNLIHHKRTRYQILSFESYEEEIRIYGDGIYYNYIPDSYDARAIFHLIQSIRHKKDERLLALGIGFGSLLNNLLKTDISYLYYFETDPWLWRIGNQYRQKYYNTEENANKLRVYLQDIRYFLSHTDEKFDLIICLPPQPENAMLNRFYTKEFYSLCNDHLKPDGIFLTSIHGFTNYMGSDLTRYIASIYKGFREEFPYHLISSGERIYLIGATGEGIIPNHYDELITNYKKKSSLYTNNKFEIEVVENFDPEELRMLFEESQIEYFTKHMIENVSGIDKNLDLKPKAYWNKTVLSAFQEKSFIYSILKRPYIPLLLSVLLIAIVLLDIRKKYTGQQFISGITIFTTGFVSISTIILLIILYQNIYGVVYYRISLINALFMLGLTLGSYYANKKQIKSLNRVFMFLIITLLLILLYFHTKIESIFWIIIISFAFFCGNVFPMLFKQIGCINYHTSASILDSMDHFGSIIGSLLTAVFLIPIFGISGTVIFNIAMLLVIMVLSKYWISNST
ncbi:MAG: hypothetical protein SVZ03_05815 [Spirochaetota bacterium]|nr:hypothetical protein [Spirochaetota bacterium]